MLKSYGTSDTDLQRAEDERAEAVAENSDREMLVVEIFDHPQAHHSNRYGATIGYIIGGDAEAVTAYLAKMGHEDYEVR